MTRWPKRGGSRWGSLISLSCDHRMNLVATNIPCEGVRVNQGRTWIRCAHVAANPESGPNANSGAHGSVAREFCAKQSRSQTNSLQGRPVFRF